MMSRIKKTNMFIIYFIAMVLILWSMVTFYVEQEGIDYYRKYEINNAEANIAIILDPDPVYDLDLQIASQIVKGIHEAYKMNVTVLSVSLLKKLHMTEFDLLVIIANTYNGQPDRAVSNFIGRTKYLLNKKVAALSIGIPTSRKASGRLIKLLNRKGADIISSETIFLNSSYQESKSRAPLTEVAKNKAYDWSIELGKLM